jgi:hypothetical protein
MDETSVKTNMAKTTGWAPRGQRLVDQAPFGHWRTQTFIGALLHDHEQVHETARSGRTFARLHARCVPEASVMRSEERAQDGRAPFLGPSGVGQATLLALQTLVTMVRKPALRGFPMSPWERKPRGGKADSSCQCREIAVWPASCRPRNHP